MTAPRGNPAPRPALRRAPDADVHPAAPKHGPDAAGGVAPRPAAEGAAPLTAPGGVPVDAAPPAEPPAPPVPPAPVGPAAVGPAAMPRTRAGVTPQPLPLTGGGLRRARGRATSDALRGKGGDKLVDLGVRVPKSLRKQLRQAAESRGMSPDELVALLLRNHLGRR